MKLQIFVPHALFADEPAVLRIVAETPSGSFGLLPRRRDCVAALTTGILVYETAAGEIFVALDGGTLVKCGPLVRVSTRRAVAGRDLAALHALVARAFTAVDDEQRSVRASLARLETGFLQRFAGLLDAR